MMLPVLNEMRAQKEYEFFRIRPCHCDCSALYDKLRGPDAMLLYVLTAPECRTGGFGT